jgi:hypothetical protein
MIIVGISIDGRLLLCLLIPLGLFTTDAPITRNGNQQYSHYANDLANGEELARFLSSRELPFELVLDGLDFLLLLKFLFTQGFTGFDLVIFQDDGEELPALPAFVRALVAGLNQR